VVGQEQKKLEPDLSSRSKLEQYDQNQLFCHPEKLLFRI